MSDQDALTPRMFIFRHGETEWAKLGRSTGITDVELTQAGLSQMSSAAMMLVGAGKLLDPCRLRHVFVSPRLRTRKTFELLLGPSSSIVAGRVTHTEDIAEWDYGKYEGCTNREVRQLRKNQGLDMERNWDILSDGCEGGEYVVLALAVANGRSLTSQRSMQQVTERLDRLIMQIRKMQKSYMRGEEPADILLVAHGLILRCFWKRWLGLSIDYPLRMMLGPGEIAILSFKHNDINEPTFHPGVQLPFERPRRRAWNGMGALWFAGLLAIALLYFY